MYLLGILIELNSISTVVDMQTAGFNIKALFCLAWFVYQHCAYSVCRIHHQKVYLFYEEYIQFAKRLHFLYFLSFPPPVQKSHSFHEVKLIFLHMVKLDNTSATGRVFHEKVGYNIVIYWMSFL